MLQQCLPLAVLKQNKFRIVRPEGTLVATVLTACGIETMNNFGAEHHRQRCNSAYRLRYWNFLALIQRVRNDLGCNSAYRLRYWNFRNVPMLLQPYGCCNSAYRLRYWNYKKFLEIWYCGHVATVLTACGIETTRVFIIKSIFIDSCNSAYRLRYWNTYTNSPAGLPTIRCNSAYRLRYWNTTVGSFWAACFNALQQCLPLAVCDEGCEAAEKQSDDEARTSLVPDQREGKTKVMK